MGVRIATLEDVPALKEVILSGLTNDSVWQYCFPSAGRSEAASNQVETVLKRVIDKENTNWLCFVVDAPKTHDPVSLAICQTLHANSDEQKSISEQVEQGKIKITAPTHPSFRDHIKTSTPGKAVIDFLQYLVYQTATAKAKLPNVSRHFNQASRRRSKRTSRATINSSSSMPSSRTRTGSAKDTPRRCASKPCR